MSDELRKLAELHGSDKGSHGYCEFYAEIFAPLRDRPLRLLELGVGGWERPDDPAFGGASLRMWRDYFPDVHVVGLDLFDKSQVAGDRVEVVRGSQDDEALLGRMVSEHGPFDIVIDDASHIPSLTLKSLEILFPLLPDGGIYVVEDVSTSYWPMWGGKMRRQARGTTMDFMKARLDGLNHAELKLPRFQPGYFDTSVLEVRARHNIVALVKGPNLEPSDLNRPNPVNLATWLQADVAPTVVQRLKRPAVMNVARRTGLLPVLRRARRALVPHGDR